MWKYICAKVLCRVTRGGVSNKVIYRHAVSVNAQQDGLWAATLTEYRPMCKGECTENDLFSVRCLRGSNVRVFSHMHFLVHLNRTLVGFQPCCDLSGQV